MIQSCGWGMEIQNGVLYFHTTSEDNDLIWLTHAAEASCYPIQCVHTLSNKHWAKLNSFPINHHMQPTFS